MHAELVTGRFLRLKSECAGASCYRAISQQVHESVFFVGVSTGVLQYSVFLTSDGSWSQRERTVVAAVITGWSIMVT